MKRLDQLFVFQDLHLKPPSPTAETFCSEVLYKTPIYNKTYMSEDVSLMEEGAEKIPRLSSGPRGTSILFDLSLRTLPAMEFYNFN